MSDTLRDQPLLTAVVVHWHGEGELAMLLDAWPQGDSRLELIVVDNSDTAVDLPPFVRRLVPRSNLGFGGGVNAGVALARGRWVLMLNPDARPAEDAINRLIEAATTSESAGIVPALMSPDGSSQHRWQLRPLPKPHQLALQGFRLIGVHGPRRPPGAGTPIPQPAAAALLIRRDVFLEIGGFDDRFFPAWFEDVDLARRLTDAGHALCYAPHVRFVHDGAASVPTLGFGRFLWLYYRHLVRYLEKHHGHAWALFGRAMISIGMLFRMLAVPLRRPRQARTRPDAAAAFFLAARGAVSGWRSPAQMAQDFETDDTAPAEGTP